MYSPVHHATVWWVEEADPNAGTSSRQKDEEQTFNDLLKGREHRRR